MRPRTIRPVRFRHRASGRRARVLASSHGAGGGSLVRAVRHARRRDRSALRPAMRGLARLSRGLSQARRTLIFGGCVAAAAWSWWEARIGGYAGLPVNTLGQILGDVLLMGIVAPLAALRRRPDRIDRRPVPPVLEALARATHRIQVLDVRMCLPEFALGTADPPGGCGGVARALESALGNDVCVEILLPDPDAPVCATTARDLGVTPEEYRSSLRCLVDDLAALPGRSDAGRLDVRVYTEQVSVSIIRCDEYFWAALHPHGALTAAPYLSLEHGGHNARALQSYFDRLHASARVTPHPRRAVPRRCAHPRHPRGAKRCPALGSQVDSRHAG
jgi:hypothetical protein